MALKIQQFFRSNRLAFYTIGGVVVGLISGLIVRNIFWPGQQPDEQLIRYVNLPGLLYIRLFMLLIVPMLIASLSTSFLVDKPVGVQALEQVNLERVILTTFGLFILFTTFASSLGVTLMALFRTKPESITAHGQTEIERLQASISQDNYRTDSVYNIFLNLVPDNMVSTMFMSSYTKSEVIWPANLSLIRAGNYRPKSRISTVSVFKSNMLGICALSIGLGLILQKLGPHKTKIFRRALLEMNAIVVYVVHLMINIMPAGMFFWMFTEGLKMHSFGETLQHCAYLMVAAGTGFAIIWLIFYPLMYLLITRRNPFRLYRDVASALLVAIGSCSSAVALPITMQAMESKQKLNRIISGLVLPLGMTVHMNGTAMYYPMVAVFVAQIKQVHYDIVSLLILCLFSVVMSMGMPALPAGGTAIVNHLAFASVLGVENPQDILVFVLAFDWIVERVRTATNVLGDCIVSACVQWIHLRNRKWPSITDNNNNNDQVDTIV